MANSTMENIQSGVKCNKELKVLKPVLENWITIVSEYSAAFRSDDACWWYTERANVGILAAAAWRTEGWLALEEYSTTKRSESKGESKNGRCDLYLGKKIGKNHSQSFALEAKRCYISFTRQNDGGKIGGSIESAWGDAGNLMKDEAERRLACTFILPYIKASDNLHEDALTEKLTKFFDEIKSNLEWDAIAWIFPKHSRTLKNVEGFYYPGVILGIHERCRGNKQK